MHAGMFTGQVLLLTRTAQLVLVDSSRGTLCTLQAGLVGAL